MVTSHSLRVGWYNVEHGHPRAAHARMILDRFEAERLDVLVLLEMHDYVHDLAKLTGHRLLRYVPARHPSDDNVAILVRNGVPVGGHWSFVAGSGYFAPGGGRRRAQRMLAARIAGVTIVTVHAPVQAWQATRRGRAWIGPTLRRLAYRRYVARLRKVARRHKGPIVFGGDWNATPTVTGRWSPDWLRRQVGGRFARPHKSTGHGEIDFAIIRAARVTSCHACPDPDGMPHSDHRLVVAVIETGAHQ